MQGTVYVDSRQFRRTIETPGGLYWRRMRIGCLVRCFSLGLARRKMKWRNEDNERSH